MTKTNELGGDLVTVRELLELSGAVEVMGDPARFAMERRRSLQLGQTLKGIAEELSDQRLALEFVEECAATVELDFTVQFSLFEGRIQLSMSSEMEQILLESWGEATIASARTQAAFLVARILARQSFPSRYAARLAGVERAENQSWEGTYCFSIELTSSGGTAQRGVWRIDYDAEVARRLDWYAVRADEGRAQQQLRRIKTILGC